MPPPIIYPALLPALKAFYPLSFVNPIDSFYLYTSKATDMTTQSHVPRKTTATLAVIALLIPLILFIVWSFITVKYGGMSKRDQVDTFLSYFPESLRNFTGVTILSLVCCVLAIILAARSFKKRLLSVRVIMTLVVLAAIFLLLFNISQLM